MAKLFVICLINAILWNCKLMYVVGDLVRSNASLSQETVAGIKNFTQEFQKSLNFSIQPCDSFRQHACDVSWKSFDRIDIFKELSEFELKNLIENYLSKSENMINSEVKIENFIKSCENWRGIQNVKDFLRNFKFQNVAERWPIYQTNCWDPKEFDLFALWTELKSYQLDGLISEKWTINHETDSYVLQIYPKGLGILEDIVTYNIKDDENRIKDDIKYHETILRHYDFRNVEEVATDSVMFHRRYLEAINTTDFHARTYTNYSELKKELNEIDWDRYFETIHGDIPTNDTPLQIVNLAGLKRFITIFKQMDPKFVLNYFFFEIFEKLHYEIREKHSCHLLASKFFPSVISRMILKQFLNENHKKTLLNIMRSAALETFRPLENETIENYLDSAIQSWETTISSLEDPEIINENYANVEISPKNFYGNFLLLRKVENKDKVRQHNYVKLRTYPEKLELPRWWFKKLLGEMLYRLQNKPSAMLLLEFYDQTWSLLASYNYRSQIAHNPETTDELTNNFHEKKLKHALITFKDWSQQNSDIIDREDEILKEFDLSNRKLFYVRLMQSVCQTEETRYVELAESFLINSEDFRKEYNCSKI